MRAMLPRDMLERFLDGHYEELRKRVSPCAGEKLAGQETSDGAQSTDNGDEGVNGLQRC